MLPIEQVSEAIKSIKDTKDYGFTMWHGRPIEPSAIDKESSLDGLVILEHKTIGLPIGWYSNLNTREGMIRYIQFHIVMDAIGNNAQHFHIGEASFHVDKSGERCYQIPVIYFGEKTQQEER